MKKVSVFTIVIIFMSLLLCYACKEENEYEKSLKLKLRSFKERAFVLPESMLAKNYNEKEPADTDLLNRPYKMVVYLNSEGCQSCKLQSLLPLYMFIRENEHLEKLGVIIILNPSDFRKVDEILSQMRFRYTVFYDLDGVIEYLNPSMPSEERFQTFLLDDKNSIVLIGNPLHNAKMKRLYMKELSK